MSTAVTSEPAPWWTEEPSSRADRARIRARIAGLHCSLCTGTIEKALGRHRGVDRVAVSLTHEQVLVDYDPAVVAPEQILSTLRDIGYDLYDPRKLRPFEEEEAQLVGEGKRLLVATGASLVAIALILNVSGVWSLLVPSTIVLTLVPIAFLILRGHGVRSAIFGTSALLAPAVVVFVGRAAGLPASVVPWIAGALAFGVVLGVAGHILRMAFQSARRGILNQHVLLEVGAFAGIAGGIIGLTTELSGFPTAAFFAVSVLVANYHIFSEWLSLLVKTRSSQAIKRLLDLQPDTARVVRDGGERDVPVSEVAVGDVVRVRPGERIPVDGEVIEGHSAVDQSLVTGEPVPIERSVGDAVIGGSINDSGTLLVRVSATSEESFLAQVVRHVEDARALKPGILHLVDRILRVYTPSVLLIAALALVGWLLGSLLLSDHVNVERAVFAGLSVLVMGYPCAVGIAAPLAIVRGSGDAADRGIIMRTGEAFQTFRLVTHVILDKTGTLTEGRPTVREIEATTTDPDELLAVAAAAESASEHPLAQAVVAAAFARGLQIRAADDFESATGLGVAAIIDGHRVLVGRPSYLAAHGVVMDSVADVIARLEAKARTVITVSRDAAVLGVIALGDAVRSEAQPAMAALRQAGLTPVLVTGDNERAARRVAEQLGIEQVHAAVLPEGKAELVRELQQHAKVAMVGDGINDAPALMQADVGIAMGAGTDIAIESADIVIVGNDLNAVLTAQTISRRSYRRTRQNVGLAFTFNGIGVPLAITGLVYPVWAMVAMALSVTTIFINSIGGRPSLLFEAIRSVGHLPAATPEPALDHTAR